MSASAQAPVRALTLREALAAATGAEAPPPVKPGTPLVGPYGQRAHATPPPVIANAPTSSPTASKSDILPGTAEKPEAADGVDRPRNRLRLPVPKPKPKSPPSTSRTAGDTDILAGTAEEPETADGVDRPWNRLSVPVPDMKSPPSAIIIVLVGVALAAMVAIAVVAVVHTRRSTHYAPVLGTVASSVDACQVVTEPQVTAAFGDNAGLPHTVLGECVYDDATRELIVEVERQDARSVFDAARSSSAQNVPGIGNAAFYDDGRLWVLEGTSLMQLTLGPLPASSPDPILLAVARSAVPRLLIDPATGKAP